MQNIYTKCIAELQMLQVFKHNQHQIDDAKQTQKEIFFKF